MKSIKETKELLLAVAGVAKHLIASKADDGKISLLELAKLIVHWRNLKVGFEGIDQIPAELKDLDTVELAELCTAVATELDVPVSEAVERRVAAYLTLVQSVIRIWRVEHGLPENDGPAPVAQPVEETETQAAA